MQEEENERAGEEIGGNATSRIEIDNEMERGLRRKGRGRKGEGGEGERENNRAACEEDRFALDHTLQCVYVCVCVCV
jgi:hypothetical protein